MQKDRKQQEDSERESDGYRKEKGEREGILERHKKMKQETEKITRKQDGNSQRDREGDKKTEEQETCEFAQFEQAVVRMYKIMQIYCPNYLSI